MSFKKMQEETQKREERTFLSFLSEKLSKAMEMKGKEQNGGPREAPGFRECMFGQNSV